MHIVVYPLDNGFYRVEVKKKREVKAFAPIQKTQILSEDAVATVVRQTAIFADLSASLNLPQGGPTSNLEERLRQIRRISDRFGKESAA